MINMEDLRCGLCLEDKTKDVLTTALLELKIERKMLLTIKEPAIDKKTIQNKSQPRKR